MPQTRIIGGGNIQPGAELTVEPLYGAMRAVARPLDYTWGNRPLGHFAFAGETGTTAGIAAKGAMFYLRNSDPTALIVVEKIRCSAIIAAAITTGVVVDIGAWVARNSTAAGTGGTLPTLGGNNQRMRISMGTSLVTDLRIATTAALTLPTGAVMDTNPFAAAITQLSFQTTTTAIAGQPITDLYDNIAHGAHPVILSSGEVLVLAPLTAGPVTGGIEWSFEVHWAEVALY